MTSGNSDIGPVVVGVDGSDASLAALARAAQEAEWRGVALHVVHALDVTPAVLHLANNQAISTRELADSDREEIWKRVVEQIGDDAGMQRVDLDGDPGKALADHARDVGASVLVVGPRGRGRVVETLLGSTARSVIKDAVCDVLLVKS